MSKFNEKSQIEQFVINQVRILREQSNISQSELAVRLGVSNGFVGQVESNRFPSKYNLNHIDKLSRIFNCSPQEFLPTSSVNKKDSEEPLI